MVHMIHAINAKKAPEETVEKRQAELNVLEDEINKMREQWIIENDDKENSGDKSDFDSNWFLE